MKKLLPFLFLLLIIRTAGAQQWKPLTSSEKYNYLLDERYATIWADSVRLVNGDSVFFLNKVLTNIKGTTSFFPYINNAYLNRSQFFLSKIIYTASKEIRMEENDSIHFLIKPYANLNDTWMFDSLRQKTAKIVGVSTMLVFGVMDSIKIITLNNTDSIILSKNNGILKFPLSDNLHKHFNLVGIEGRNSGTIMPTYKNMFDFKVGDVFYYYRTESDRWIMSYDEYKKLVINSKEITGDTIKYHVNFKGVKTYYDFLLNKHDTVIKNIPDSIWIFHSKSSSLLDKYSGQLLQGQLYAGDYYKPVSIVTNMPPFQGIAKTYPFRSFCKAFNDTVFQSINYCSDQQDSSRYVPGFGCIYSGYYQHFTGSSYVTTTMEKLIGVIRDGKLIGEAIQDSLFLAVPQLKLQVDYKMYPNPATSVFTMEMDVKLKKANLQIFDMNGKMLMEKQLSDAKTDIDIGNLAKGVYVVKFLTEHGIGVEKLIKK